MIGPSHPWERSERFGSVGLILFRSQLPMAPALMSQFTGDLPFPTAWGLSHLIISWPHLPPAPLSHTYYTNQYILCIQHSYNTYKTIPNAAQHWCITHFPCTQQFETPQGASVDSLGVGVIEIRHKYVPNRWQCHQEVLKCCLAMPASFLGFLARTSQQRGLWDPLCSFHAAPWRWEA